MQIGRGQRSESWYGREPGLIFLFILIYGAFGIQSPFFPVFLQERGMDASSIGILLAMGTAIKLVSAPLIGGLADRLSSWSGVLAVALVGCSAMSLSLLGASTPVLLFVAVALQAVCLGPVPTIADALALNSGARVAYGSVRGAGAGAFIFFSNVSGRLVEQFGTSAIFAASSLLSALAAAPLLLRAPTGQSASASAPGLGNLAALHYLLALRSFRLVIVTSGLVLGSHALHDGFTAVRWAKSGMLPSTIGLLWSIAVASEVIVFFFLGRRLLQALGPARACALAAIVAALRWSVMALTASLPMMLMVQPLHGLTFGLLHLACMQLITEAVPVRLAATAQGAYATLGPGLASVLVTSLSGLLYARYGASAFWAMSFLAMTALLPAFRIQRLADEHPPISKG